jgi:hypothetical protein
MKLAKTLFVLLTIIFFASCSKDDTPQEETPQTIVHAVGDEIIPAGIGVFVLPTVSYWKNNVKTPTGFSRGFGAKSIFINNNKIYIAGQDTPASTQIPCYSENGTRVSLGTTEGFANSIYVKNNDIYVGGFTQASDIKTAKYWKNGIVFPLTNGTRSAEVKAIYVDGTDVYCAGYEENEGSYKAKYWKNGEAITLSTAESICNSILVFGGDVYTCGSQYNSAGKSVATIWKNNNKVDITNGSTDAEAFELKILDGKAYVVFEEENSVRGINVKYCKIDIATGLDKQIINLTDYTDIKKASAKTIFLHNNDIYVGGSNTNGTTTVPTIWKNGVANAQSQNYGTVNSLFVTN